MEYNFVDNTYEKKEGIGVIYLAGGCFWGLERLLKAIPGVVQTVVGYANGHSLFPPTYEMVCTGSTGFRETVRVEYQKDTVSLDAILFAFFETIDVTAVNRQGADRGTQYQSGVYYIDSMTEEILERVVGVVRRRAVDFAVEWKPLENFYMAEPYHQGYLQKTPNGYCHISVADMVKVGKMFVDPSQYLRPSDTTIQERLDAMQYHVTQEGGTEPPFSNPYWNKKEQGIYVDIVTGEPLFSSEEKYESSCGWPSFTGGIDRNAFAYLKDTSLGMERTEVRSRSGNAHLGHVFYQDEESPNGVRYCINGAALRFIPYEEMEKEGYGYLRGRCFVGERT